MSDNVIACLKNVSKSFAKGKLQILKDVNLSLPAGKLVALCGPSGSGKSTLLQLIAGLDRADSGEVLLFGREAAREKQRVQNLRHNLGFVLQLHCLLPGLSLQENIMLPALAAGVSYKVAHARMLELTGLTGLSERLQHNISKLSGGERQRVALCRALVNKPKLIIADEPTGSLDPLNSAQVFALLLDLVRKHDCTLLMATHDTQLAERCDEIWRISQGTLLASPGMSR